jgi:hypothetical protein
MVGQMLGYNQIFGDGFLVERRPFVHRFFGQAGAVPIWGKNECQPPDGSRSTANRDRTWLSRSFYFAKGAILQGLIPVFD